MTNKDAIYILSGLKRSLNEYCGLNTNGQKAFDMAISALQAQEAKTQLSREDTTSDLISRRAAIDVCSNAIDIWHGMLGEGIVIAVRKNIEELPSAQPKIEERKEESAQNVPKEDLISRKAAIDAECEVCQIAPKKERGHNCTYYVHGCKEIECLRALPSAQPEPCEDAVSREAAIDAALSAFSRGLLASPDIRKLPSVQPERKTGWWLIREGISDAQCSECQMYFRDVYDMDNSDAFCRHCGAKMEGLKVVEDE